MTAKGGREIEGAEGGEKRKPGEVVGAAEARGDVGVIWSVLGVGAGGGERWKPGEAVRAEEAME